MKPLCIIIIVLILIAIVSSSKSAETNKPPETIPPAPFEKILSALRDPFWPVGWAPQSTPLEETPHVTPGPQTSTQQPETPIQLETSDWNVAWKTIKIRAKSQNWAIIDGHAVIPKGPVAIGDIISVIHKGKKYRWRIVSITKEEGITAERIDVTKLKGD